MARADAKADHGEMSESSIDFRVAAERASVRRCYRSGATKEKTMHSRAVVGAILVLALIGGKAQAQLSGGSPPHGTAQGQHPGGSAPQSLSGSQMPAGDKDYLPAMEKMH